MGKTPKKKGRTSSTAKKVPPAPPSPATDSASSARALSPLGTVLSGTAPSNVNMTSPPAPAFVHAPSALNLPQFYVEDPALWFLQADAQMNARGIVSETVRFGLVVSALPSPVANEVRDFLISPSSISPYSALKAAVLSRVGPSARQRLQRLLAAEELGDRSPSQMLRRMRQCLGDSPHESETRMLRELFMQRLPGNIRLVLSALPDSPLDVLAESADRMIESAAPAPRAIHAVSAPNLSKEVAELTRMVADLQRTVEQLSFSSKQQRGGARSQSTGRPTKEDESLCWFHQRFGERATRCKPPCTYVSTALVSEN